MKFKLWHIDGGTWHLNPLIITSYFIVCLFYFNQETLQSCGWKAFSCFFNIVKYHIEVVISIIYVMFGGNCVKMLSLQVYRDVWSTPVTKPYMAHRVRGTVWGLHFCPFEDVLGVGHQDGFTSMLVPGQTKFSLEYYKSVFMLLLLEQFRQMYKKHFQLLRRYTGLHVRWLVFYVHSG